MPELITLVDVQIAVGPGEGDLVNLMIGDPASGRQYTLPLPPESAKTIGQALIAPRVQQPPASKLALPR